MITNILSIAGVDPSGGAGIAADLKTFSALGVYGMAVVTAVTAQNTREVTAVRLMDPAFVTEQIDAVFGDVRVDAVKIGMVATAEIAAAIAEALARHRAQHIVLDPVMIAKSGDRLLAEAAIAALRERLIPLAEVVTPNLPEGAALLGTSEPGDLDGMRTMAHELLRFGSWSVLLKGGHLHGPESIDVLADAGGEMEFAVQRIATKNTHGTGCTLSSAIAALLPTRPRAEAIRTAKDYLTDALRAAGDLTVGSGHGPVHHFHGLWNSDRR
jgi:hydroxymethylpyrimidine/phosphomethylpyrimidine kinase